MSQIKIASTRNTPSVSYSAKDSLLVISGKSYPEDARSFYTTLTTQLLEQKSPEKLNIHFDFEYLSSSSVACILQLLKDIKAKHTSTQFTLEIKHDSGDDDMISVGENFHQLTGMPISFMVRSNG